MKNIYASSTPARMLHHLVDFLPVASMRKRVRVKAEAHQASDRKLENSENFFHFLLIELSSDCLREKTFAVLRNRLSE
jgi:hypothetical protein